MDVSAASARPLPRWCPLSLSDLVCKMGVRAVASPWGLCEDDEESRWSVELSALRPRAGREGRGLSHDMDVAASTSLGCLEGKQVKIPGLVAAKGGAH